LARVWLPEGTLSPSKFFLGPDRGSKGKGTGGQLLPSSLSGATKAE